MELVEYIESTVDQPQIEMTEEQKALIRSRAAELQADPSLGLTWSELRARGVTSRALVFHPEVEDDLASILDYYETFDPALPSRFEARLDEQIDRSELFPESGAILFESYRRVRSTGSCSWRSTSLATTGSNVLALVSVRRDPASIEETVCGPADG